MEPKFIIVSEIRADTIAKLLKANFKIVNEADGYVEFLLDKELPASFNDSDKYKLTNRMTF